MEHREDKSTIDQRLTGVRDPQDPDGLMTVEQAENPPDRAAFGTDEKDTLDLEQRPGPGEEA
ncbi:MAG: hypothetical protein JWQ68_260 [Cryobacterium sp.]|jgi:hypothetical protein|nr:hypothetical protein [Cryobacterium sp.]